MMDKASEDGPGAASCPSRYLYLLFDKHPGHILGFATLYLTCLFNMKIRLIKISFESAAECKL